MPAPVSRPQRDTSPANLGISPLPYPSPGGDGAPPSIGRRTRGAAHAPLSERCVQRCHKLSQACTAATRMPPVTILPSRTPRSVQLTQVVVVLSVGRCLYRITAVGGT